MEQENLKVTISFDDLCEYLFEGLIDLGLAPTEDEVELIASIVLDFFVFEVLGLDVEEID